MTNLHHQLKFDVKLRTTILVTVGLLLATTPDASNASRGGNPTGASVDLINSLNDSVTVHCWSKDTDFGATTLYPNTNYYWKFHPNIFGRTVFTCTFSWRDKRQQFAVWEGSYHDDRLPCCMKGPCNFKICGNGIYNALTVETDQNGPAESWEFYKSWLPVAT
ncbi:S-protein homolog 3-like [Physcomitrium patens]